MNAAYEPNVERTWMSCQPKFPNACRYYHSPKCPRFLPFLIGVGGNRESRHYCISGTSSRSKTTRSLGQCQPVSMPHEIRRAEKEQRLAATLAFAKSIEESLQEDAGPPSSLTSDLYRQVDGVLLISKEVAASRNHELDRQGTRLWNLASKYKSHRSANPELLCLLRVFPCLLLDCAQRLTENYVPNDIRVLKLALKTAKYCLDQNQLSLAERVFERAAFYEERLTRLGGHTDQDQSTSAKRLSKEYQTLRIALAWRQDRLDLAELMLTKLSLIEDKVDPSTAENLADLLFEIGSAQWKKSLYTEAVHWLEKAYDVLVGQSLEALSSDAGELQVSIMHLMIRALIKLPGEGNWSKAWNIMGQLEIDSGNRLAVLLLKLDLYAIDPSASAQEYCGVLQRISRTVHLTDSNLKTTIHHVHKLRLGSPRMAHMALETLLFERLLEAEEPAWMEKALITMIWNCTTSTDLTDALDLLRNALDTLFANTGKAIQPSPTHAAQILLWKRIEANFNQEIYDVAEAWCHLSLHKSFGNSGDLNVGKLQRKLILCALGTSNSAKAREIYDQMSESNRRDPSTQFLLYKLALKCKDQQLAIECLEGISLLSTKEANVLYACVLEAQRTGEHLLTVISLQRVLSKYDYGAPNIIYLPALLRCTARLLVQETENSSSPVKDAANEICKLFDGAASQAKVSTRALGNQVFSLAELNWFSRNSYNLALKVCIKWEPPQTLTLVQACLKFIDLYPSGMDAGIVADMSLQRLFCDFLAGSLLTLMARGEDQIKIQLQHYLGVRKYADDFRTHLQGQLSRLEGRAASDLLSKYSSLLAFDFEAAVNLKSWDSLEKLVKDCKRCEDPTTFGILADNILSSEAPSQGAFLSDL